MTNYRYCIFVCHGLSGTRRHNYVDWVCRFSTLLWEVFPQVLRFSPLIKNQHLIWFDLWILIVNNDLGNVDLISSRIVKRIWSYSNANLHCRNIKHYYYYYYYYQHNLFVTFILYREHKFSLPLYLWLIRRWLSHNSSWKQQWVSLKLDTKVMFFWEKCLFILFILLYYLCPEEIKKK